MDGEDRYHYQLMCRALALVASEEGRALSLAALAARLEMSPAHFQRLFSAWVGVSPKRYQQHLALALAKAGLAAGAPVAAAAAQAGLSGPGRLHDLFISWEAMSPGTWARRAAGMTLAHGWFDSPFGPALAVGTETGLCGLAFAAETGREAALSAMAAHWPEARLVKGPGALQGHVDAAFSGHGRTPARVMAPPFRIKVWQALLEIPPGRVASYGEIARAIGQPRAARAVGGAVGRNPLAFLIPCHRVIGASGALVGYRWGLPVKRAMLGWEAARGALAEPAGGSEIAPSPRPGECL